MSGLDMSEAVQMLANEKNISVDTSAARARRCAGHRLQAPPDGARTR